MCCPVWHLEESLPFVGMRTRCTIFCFRMVPTILRRSMSSAADCHNHLRLTVRQAPHLWGVLGNHARPQSRSWCFCFRECSNKSLGGATSPHMRPNDRAADLAMFCLVNQHVLRYDNHAFHCDCVLEPGWQFGPAIPLLCLDGATFANHMFVFAIVWYTGARTQTQDGTF